MKRIKLTKEEKEIERSLVKGEYVTLNRNKLEEIRKNLLSRKKDLTMTIRVNGDDIKRIKKKAAKLGVKYQTFISEVLHQVAH